MHQRGQVVSLEHVLGAIDGSGMEWRVSSLQALSKSDSDLDVIECESKTRNHEGGLLLTDAEFRALACQLSQVIDGEFRGFVEGTSRDSGVAALVELAAFDSTEWTVTIADSAVDRLDRNAAVSW
jgi:hypothetical protein